jgi:hypothetical protein
MVAHDPAGDFGDEAGAPDNDQDIVSPAVLHIHAHSHRDGGPLADESGTHVHAHDHAPGELDDHEHDHGHGTEFFDANGVAWAADYQPGGPDPDPQYASSSGRRPSGGVHRRSQDWGAPTDLSSRLTAFADEVAQIQRSMYQCHEALLDLDSELDTPDTLRQRDELQRVWLRLTEQEAQAHSRLRTAQAAWAKVERDFTFGREGDHIRGAVAEEPWERAWRAERDAGLSNIDRDRG